MPAAMVANRWKRLSLPGIAGVLGFASFPTADQGYLAWIALVGLVVFVSQSASAKEAFLGGFVSGAIQAGLLLPWITRVLTHYGGLSAAPAWLLFFLLVAVLACYPAVACALVRTCIAWGGRKYLLAFPLSWVAMEYVQAHFPEGGFPWLLMGYSQTNYARVIQVSDLTGVYGVSFLVLWVNTVLAWLILRRRQPRAFIWPLVSAVVALGGTLLYGDAALKRWGRIVPDHRAALLQGNLSFDDDPRELVWKFLDGYLEMAGRLEPGTVDLLVLPESPSPRIFQFDPHYREGLQKLAGRFPLGVIFNNISCGREGDGSDYFNSAYFLNREGQELGRYDKIHLVPFGEYIPWRGLLPFARSISKDVGAFTPGGRYLTVALEGRPVNVIICFEAVIPQLTRRFVAGGSGLIVNLTNDGWYGNSAAPYQHLAMARWRAVENRRYLLRAANSGISAIVDPTGRIHNATRLLQRDTCVGEFAFLELRSPYSQYGDVFAILCAIIFYSLLVVNGCLKIGKGWPRRNAVGRGGLPNCPSPPNPRTS